MSDEDIAALFRVLFIGTVVYVLFTDNLPLWVTILFIAAVFER